jgi:hypothetical protein
MPGSWVVGTTRDIIRRGGGQEVFTSSIPPLPKKSEPCEKSVSFIISLKREGLLK